MLDRRALVLASLAVLAGPATAAPVKMVQVYKAWGCTCCEGWIAAMHRANFRTQATVVEDLSPHWRRYGIPYQLSSCHMGVVDGYVTVGHVPPADLRRLLAERPKAIGLSVPGMPDGSPGMERADGKVDPYETVLILPGGKWRTWARHA